MPHASDVPCCYHPSTVLFMEDDKAFHEKSIAYLSVDNVSCSFQLSPFSSLSIINKYQDPIQADSEIYNVHRHSRVSVVVTDQFMTYKGKRMLGTELLDQIEHANVRRILVSGRLDIEQGLEIVNAGKVQSFVHKDKGNPYERVAGLVDALVPEFFRQETGTFQEVGDRVGSPVNNPSFVSYFLELVRKFNLSEYYLIDPAGTVMFVGPNKEVYGLCARTHTQLQEMAREAKEKGAPHPVVHSLERCQCILCPPDPSDQGLSQDLAWDRCLYPVVRCLAGQGRDAVYCGFSPGMLETRSSAILSLYQYQNLNPGYPA